MKVWRYVRSEPPNAAEQLWLQIKAIQSICDDNNIEIIGESIVDGSQTIMTNNLENLIEQILNAGGSHLFVLDYSVLGADKNYIITELAKNNIKVVSKDDCYSEINEEKVD